MAKYGLVIDLTRCAGCRTCTAACQMQNELEPYERWLRLQEVEDGKFPSATRRFLTVQCQHCDKPPCIAVCPVLANYKRKDGIVMIDEDRCIGCKYCIVACPYQARIFNEERGVAQKCWLCYKRVEKGVVEHTLAAMQTAGITNRPSGILALFSTHPPIPERVERLTEMAQGIR